MKLLSFAAFIIMLLCFTSCGTLGITTPPIVVPSFTIPPITLKPDAKSTNLVQP